MQERHRNGVDAIAKNEMFVARDYGSPHQPEGNELPALREPEYVSVRKVSAGPERIFGAACPCLRPQPNCTYTDFEEDQQNRVPDDGSPKARSMALCSDVVPA